MRTVALLFALCPAVLTAQSLESFETDQTPLVSPSGCRVERVREHATDGEWALKVEFPGPAEDTWPGLVVRPQRQAFTRRDIFVVDVFNPQPDPVSLSCRVDSADGRNVFTGQSLAPQTATKVEIWIASLAGQVDIANIARFYPYLSKPHADAVLFFDHFRIESNADRFARIAYAEIAAPPEPSEAERAFGAYVFSRSPLAHVFANSVPWPGERVDALEIVCAPGETETRTISVRSLEPIDRVVLGVSPLRGDSATIPAAAVELGCVRFLDKKSTYSSKEYYAGLPTYADPGSSFESLPAGVSRTFWLRFRAPRDAVPGTYAGEANLIAATPAGERTFAMPIVVRIWPVVLPDIARHFVGEYYRLPPNSSDDEKRTAIARDLEDMRDHGMTTVGLCFGLDTDKVVVENGRIANLGLDGTSLFEHFMQTYLALGFTMPIVLLADSGQGVAAKAGPYGSPEYEAAYKAFWSAVQTAGRERGWPEIVVQPVDEPGWQDQESKDRNARLLALLKEIPGMRTEQDGPGDAYFHDIAGPVSDLWNYNGAVVAFDRIAEIRKQHLVTFYNNDVESYRPEVDRYVSGFYQNAAGIDGVFNWEYRGGSGDLYDDLDGPTGDWVHSYPPSDTSQGGPSIAWEAAREGVDDLRYLTVLETWIAKASTTPGAETVAQKAQEVLDRLLESLRAEPRVRGRDLWSARWSRAEADALGLVSDADAQAFVGGFLKHPNGWTYRDYDRARRATVSHTLRLMAACGLPVAWPQPEAGAASIEVLGCVSWPTPADRSGQASNDTGRTRVVLPQLKEAPTLDGLLDDPVWRDALRVPAFVSNMGGTRATVQTEACAGWHGENLYVGLRCHEPAMGALVVNIMEDGEAVWEDDCVELFFDPATTRKTFAQLAVNPRGVQWSKTPEGTPWPARVPVQVLAQADGWSVETAVPLAFIGGGTQPFGFNLARERRAGGDLDLSCWQPTGETFGIPERFALAVLEGMGQAETAAETVTHLVVRAADALLLSEDVVDLEMGWENEAVMSGCDSIRVRLLQGDRTLAECDAPAGRTPRWRLCLRVGGVPEGSLVLEATPARAGAAIEAAKVAHPVFVP